MRKVIATLKALVEVMEALSKDADPDGVGRLIMEEVLFQIICITTSKREIIFPDHDQIIFLFLFSFYSVIKCCFGPCS